MKFSTREDVSVPIEHAFAMVSDFEGFERAALRRGAEVSRADRLRGKAPGMIWKIAFDWRHKRRRLVAELTDYIAPTHLRVEAEGAAVTGFIALELIALSPRRTRIQVELEFRPKTLAARLYIQSLRLTRGRQTARFRTRVAEFARRIERGHEGHAGAS